MAGGGGGDDVSRAQQPGGKGEPCGHGQKPAWLPLDIVVAEIAARSDPATLVRCAATCRDARRRIADDPSLLLGRLCLRATERFVPSLLRGHLTGITTYKTGDHKTDVYMVDTTGAADATRLVKATFADADETLRNVSMDSRGGLVLVRANTTTTATAQRQLLVCNLATGHCQALPPDEPVFPGGVEKTGVEYVLLVGERGDGATAVGRPFQVIKAKLVLSQYRKYRRLLVHTFSSEHGVWSPLTEIPTPNLQASDSSPLLPLQRRPLVVGGDVVHWLCLTDAASCMLMLHVRAARVNVTPLPANFPRDGEKNPPYHSYDVSHYRYLLATATAGGNPVVLVADGNRISAWEQWKHARMWKPWPQVVIENETILGFKFKDDG